MSKSSDIHCPECGSFIQSAPSLDSDNELYLDCDVCGIEFIHTINEETDEETE